jgi:hypothetical protein
MENSPATGVVAVCSKREESVPAAGAFQRRRVADSFTLSVPSGNEKRNRWESGEQSSLRNICVGGE